MMLQPARMSSLIAEMVAAPGVKAPPPGTAAGSLTSLSWLTPNSWLEAARGSADERPPYGYAALVYDAVLSSQKEHVALGEIYGACGARATLCAPAPPAAGAAAHRPRLVRRLTARTALITRRWRFFEVRTAETGWRNSVRHNLTTSSLFAKVARGSGDPGKGGYWRIDPRAAPPHPLPPRAPAAVKESESPGVARVAGGAEASARSSALICHREGIRRSPRVRIKSFCQTNLRNLRNLSV